MIGAIAIGGSPPEVYEFRADHPFLYLIIDSQKRTILFLGRVMEPEGSLPPSGAKPNRPRPLRKEFVDELDRLRNLRRE